MQWTTDIDPAGLIIALERLEDRFQKGERSVKLQAEAQQIIGRCKQLNLFKRIGDKKSYTAPIV